MSTKTLILPENYKSSLDIKETQLAIKFIKDTFQIKLANALNLTRVTSPKCVLSDTGVNDDLNGVESAIKFDIPNIYEYKKAEIIHSLAKWKREALSKYKFKYGEGLYTDMDAIRRDEILDSIHSIYVDQWDWEIIINESERTINFLQHIVTKIYNVIISVERDIAKKYPDIIPMLPDNIYFIDSEKLLSMYPDITPHERENKICKLHGAVFIMRIGCLLSNGQKHDGRAPDYDDWELNGDIIIWNPVISRSFELSSMGIRVDNNSLIKQLNISNNTDRLNLDWHKKLINNEFPLTIGGGIGQSRLCMYYLRKAHIGEVQCGIWPQHFVNKLKEHNIELL